jgi:hypothetical protein
VERSFNETKNAAVESATAVPPNTIPLVIVSIGRNPVLSIVLVLLPASAPYTKSRIKDAITNACANLIAIAIYVGAKTV